MMDIILINKKLYTKYANLISTLEDKSEHIVFADNIKYELLKDANVILINVEPSVTAKIKDIAKTCYVYRFNDELNALSMMIELMSDDTTLGSFLITNDVNNCSRNAIEDMLTDDKYDFISAVIDSDSFMRKAFNRRAKNCRNKKKYIKYVVIATQVAVALYALSLIINN